MRRATPGWCGRQSLVTIEHRCRVPPLPPSPQRLPAARPLGGARLATTLATALAGALVGSAATAGVITATHPPTRLGDALRPPGAHGATAYVVAQSRDCTSNLDFLDLFERPPIRDRVALAAAIALGAATATDTLRRALAVRDLHPRVLHADRALARALRTLGHHTTPYLVVLDADGAVRYSADAPATRADYHRLADDLRQLAAPPPATTTR